MDPESDKTFEERVLESRPEIRREVAGSPEFQAFKEQVPTVDVDGATLYVRGGDMLQDEAQLAFDWAYQQGLLTDADVEAAAREQADAYASSEDIELTDLEQG